MHGSKLGYSSINAARSALSTFVLSRYDNWPIGNSALVKRFMRGIFVLDPPRPIYARIWDVKVVLKYLKSLWPINKLDLKQLTFKLAMLMALITAQRAQTIHLLN